MSVSMSLPEAMSLALEEARKGFAFVSPNPQVGCVILDSEDRLLSKGHHQRFGGPHAEVEALRGLSEKELKNATVIVTLEPCAHEGKTPSCAKTLAKLPIKRVIYGLEDPNPLVKGQGAQILREAGITCDLYRELVSDDLEPALEEVCEAFLWNFRQRQVFVGLKVAVSLDSQMAMASGESKWITGAEARQEVHRLRAAYDAVMVGAGTVLADDPTLDVRLPGLQKKNRAVVLDANRALREQKSSLKLSSRPTHEVLWIEGERDSQKILSQLWDAGLRSVLIEGGSKVASQFLQAGLVNRLYLFQAPVILGHQGRSWTEFVSLSRMSDRWVLQSPRTQAFGRDLLTTGLLRDPKTGQLCRDM